MDEELPDIKMPKCLCRWLLVTTPKYTMWCPTGLNPGTIDVHSLVIYLTHAIVTLFPVVNQYLTVMGVEVQSVMWMILLTA